MKNKKIHEESLEWAKGIVSKMPKNTKTDIAKKKIDKYFDNISPEELEKKMIEHGFEFIIQPQDLRVGNKLLVNDLVATVVEIKVYTAKVQYGEKYAIVEYEKLKPIRLNEVELINLGFNPIGTTSTIEHYVKEVQGVDIEIDLDINRLLVSGIELKFNGYLHELQNALYILSTPN